MRSLGVVLLAVVLVVGTAGVVTSGAWFTDQDSVDTNAIYLGGLNPQVVGAPFTVDAAEPGVPAGTQTLNLVNGGGSYPASTIAAKYRIRATSFVGSPVVYDTMQVVAEYYTGSEWVTAYNGLLSTMDINPTNFAPTGNLGVEQTHYWRFTYTPASTLDNLSQGLSCVFNLVVDSTQTANPGWTE